MRSVVLAGLLASCGRYATAQTGIPSVSDFDWSTVKPSTSLDYTTCYASYKCAKLSVPLDWLEPSAANSTARVTIAITTLPAVVPESDPSFGGTIIINPGGPGGSGVEYVLESGTLLQGIADGTKHYEILSFDPRGVGLTEPKGDCYNDEFSRAVTTVELRAMGPLDSGLNVVDKQTSLYGAYGSLCEAGPEILAYMSTASVARDMVEIVDKIDELRNQNSTLKSSKVPRIQYWGLSYGTVLGNYFASMFPGRVGRMVLEGVVDIHDWNAGEWAKNLQDTLKVYDIFWTSCFEAGPKCALYQPNDTSPDAIRHRVEAFLDDLDAAPAQYVSKSSIEEITKADAIYLILQALYQPQQLFPTAATLLAEAMAGNFTLLHRALALPTPADSCLAAPKETYTWTADAMAAIACGDAASQAGLSTPAFLSYLAQQKATAGAFAAWWARVRLGCKGWRVRPAYRFEGPFTTPRADPSVASSAEGRPAAPLLFLSSLYDPATPRANAVAMAAEHAGAGVLVLDGAGHGTQGTPSRCRDSYLRRYLESGVVPPEGTVCEADCIPFQDCPQVAWRKRGLGGASGLEGFRRRWAPL
ncbi:alpha/beta-hydrolase [Hypoxylon sp. FL0543]|nr:alpha/beta-hydrolase [Hypoxylon sp. FL0543]